MDSMRPRKLPSGGLSAGDFVENRAFGRTVDPVFPGVRIVTGDQPPRSVGYRSSESAGAKSRALRFRAIECEEARAVGFACRNPQRQSNPRLDAMRGERRFVNPRRLG